MAEAVYVTLFNPMTSSQDAAITMAGSVLHMSKGIMTPYQMVLITLWVVPSC